MIGIDYHFFFFWDYQKGGYQNKIHLLSLSLMECFLFLKGRLVLVTPHLEVGICGSSRYMTDIGASLHIQGKIRVTRLGDSLAEAALEIKMLSPHAVLFEMSDSDAGEAVIAAILQEHPGIKLINLEPNSGAITVFSAREHLFSSLEELEEIIRN